MHVFVNILVGLDLGASGNELSPGSRLALKQGLAAIAAYECSLGKRLIQGLEAIPGIRIYGITDEAYYQQRTPTIDFTKEGISPAEIAKKLGKNNIFVWNGHYYAIEVVFYNPADLELFGEPAVIGHLAVGNPDFLNDESAPLARFGSDNLRVIACRHRRRHRQFAV